MCILYMCVYNLRVIHQGMTFFSTASVIVLTVPAGNFEGGKQEGARWTRYWACRKAFSWRGAGSRRVSKQEKLQEQPPRRMSRMAATESAKELARNLDTAVVFKSCLLLEKISKMRSTQESASEKESVWNCCLKEAAGKLEQTR